MAAFNLGAWAASFFIVAAVPWILLRIAARPTLGTATKIALAIAGWLGGLFLFVAALTGGSEPNIGHFLALCVTVWLTLRLLPKGLNGWHRLFVLLLVITGVLAVGLWTVTKPNDSSYAAGCIESFYSRAEAQQALVSRTFGQAQYSIDRCEVSLSRIAQGIPYRHAMKQWRDSFTLGLAVLLAFWAIIYAIGAGLGWVWRGFKPPMET